MSILCRVRARPSRTYANDEPCDQKPLARSGVQLFGFGMFMHVFENIDGYVTTQQLPWPTASL